jgi:integrase
MSNIIPTSNSDNFCKQIKHTGKTQYFRDKKTAGLRLRITPTGKKLWVYGYSIKISEKPLQRSGDNYKNRSMSLGAFNHGTTAPAGSLTVKQAREKALSIKAAIQEGKDPAQERKTAEAERIAQDAAKTTINELFDHWLTNELSRRKDNGSEAARMIRKDVLPVIGQLPIEQVKKAHISKINTIVKARGLRIANVVFSLMRQMFSYAVELDYIEHNPTAGIKKSKVGTSGIERDRVLEDKEIRELFLKLPKAGMVEVNTLTIPLVLSTCCRIGELLKARWADINLSERVWIIPAENSKNGKHHKIYLSDFSLKHFEKLYAITGDGEWCYPASRKEGHINEKTITKQIRDRQRSGEPLSSRTSRTEALILTSASNEAWKPHDLRRTGATLMTALGVIPEVAERCLNHTEQNRIKRTYQRHNYWHEMKRAWNLLGDRLELLSTRKPNNITPLRITSEK